MEKGEPSQRKRKRSSSDEQDNFFRYPGFRFKPTDEELFGYYLKRKVTGQSARGYTIPELDVYNYVPWDLPRLSGSKSKDSIWYFLTPNNPNYPKAERSFRTAKGGGWKIKGKDTIVYSGSRRVGYVKQLIYFTNKVTKTDWVMLEYKLDDYKLTKDGVPQQSHVLNKVFQVGDNEKDIKGEYGGPFEEKDWESEEEDQIPVTCDGITDDGTEYGQYMYSLLTSFSHY